jgi:hypothetical protein
MRTSLINPASVIVNPYPYPASRDAADLSDIAFKCLVGTVIMSPLFIPRSVRAGDAIISILGAFVSIFY